MIKENNVSGDPDVLDFLRAEKTELHAVHDVFIKFYKYDAKTTSEVALDYTIQGRQINSFIGGRDVGFFGATIGATLDQGDQIFIKVMNNSSTQNITAEGFSFFRVQER